MKRKPSQAIDAKLRKAALVGLSKLEDLSATIAKLADFLATLDPKGLKEFERTLKVATKEEKWTDAMRSLEGLPLKHMAILSQMALVPKKRGRRKTETNSDDEIVAEGRRRVAAGEDRGEVINDLAPKCKANSMESAKRRLRRKIPSAARGQSDI